MRKARAFQVHRCAVCGEWCRWHGSTERWWCATCRQWASDARGDPLDLDVAVDGIDSHWDREHDDDETARGRRGRRDD